jgi:hypothetical protein
MQTYLSTKCFNFYLEENIKIEIRNERNIDGIIVPIYYAYIIVSDEDIFQQLVNECKNISGFIDATEVPCPSCGWSNSKMFGLKEFSFKTSDGPMFLKLRNI